MSYVLFFFLFLLCRDSRWFVLMMLVGDARRLMNGWWLFLSLSFACSLCSIHVVPFQETLPQEETQLTEADLIERYLKPYFADKTMFLQVGSRLQIKEVDFKVTACLPAKGICSSDTQLVVASAGTRGVGSTRSFFSALQQLTRVHILPTQASVKGKRLLPAARSSIYRTHVQPYFLHENIHLHLGAQFFVDGIEFRVVASEPNNGVVAETTEVFTEGDPLPDLTTLHLLPFIETLPNREKNLTEEQLFERYFDPYFMGAGRIISAGILLYSYAIFLVRNFPATTLVSFLVPGLSLPSITTPSIFSLSLFFFPCVFLFSSFSSLFAFRSFSSFSAFFSFSSLVFSFFFLISSCFMH